MMPFFFEFVAAVDFKQILSMEVLESVLNTDAPRLINDDTNQIFESKSFLAFQAPKSNTEQNVLALRICSQQSYEYCIHAVRLLSEILRLCSSDLEFYYVDRLELRRKNGGVSIYMDSKTPKHQQFWKQHLLELLPFRYTVVDSVGKSHYGVI